MLGGVTYVYVNENCLSDRSRSEGPQAIATAHTRTLASTTRMPRIAPSRLLVILQSQMRDLFLTHQVPKRILQLGLLNEKIMLRQESRSGHRRLVIEA